MDIIDRIESDSKFKQENYENEFLIGKKRIKTPQFPEL